MQLVVAVLADICSASPCPHCPHEAYFFTPLTIVSVTLQYCLQCAGLPCILRSTDLDQKFPNLFDLQPHFLRQKGLFNVSRKSNRKHLPNSPEVLNTLSPGFSNCCLLLGIACSRLFQTYLVRSYSFNFLLLMRFLGWVCSQ